MDLLTVLHRALSVKRPHGSREEAAFTAWLAQNVPLTLIDGAGNLHVDLRKKPHHRTCFTSHTDTVHQEGGTNLIDRDGQFWRAKGAPLGADDGAGVALMMHMIHAKVPGLFIFFRNEEGGGTGSTYLAQEAPDLLKGIDRAIAFDRAGYHDVITHQAGGRCCSDEFAYALSEELTSEDLSTAYMPSDQGVFTDTANLTEIVPEGTNLSIGYFLQHSNQENQDVDYLRKLADKLVTVQWDDLPTVRVPTPVRELRCGSTVRFGVSFDTRSDYGDAAQNEALILELESALDGDPTGLLARLQGQSPMRGYLAARTLENAYDDALSGMDDDLVLQYLMENFE